MKELTARFVETLVGVSTKVITLSLQQVRRQASGSVTVEVSQSGGDRRHRNSQCDGSRCDSTPRSLSCFDGFLKERIEQQVGKLSVLFERIPDVVQKCTADDATASPHQRNRSIVQFPFFFVADGPHQLIALGVGNDFRCVQRLFQIVDERGFVAFKFGAGTGKRFRCFDSFFFHR